MMALQDHRESADTFRGELFRAGRHRVILCRDGIQWILQTRKGGAGNGAGPRWKALGYFATREALLRLWTTKTGGAAPEIAALPERLRRQGPATILARKGGAHG